MNARGMNNSIKLERVKRIGLDRQERAIFAKLALPT